MKAVDQSFEEYLDEAVSVTYDGFQITRRQVLIGYEFVLVKEAFYEGWIQAMAQPNNGL